MEKTLIITIVVDNVELDDLGLINTELERVLSDFENKRITIQLQDEPMITRR